MFQSFDRKNLIFYVLIFFEILNHACSRGQLNFLWRLLAQNTSKNTPKKFFWSFLGQKVAIFDRHWIFGYFLGFFDQKWPISALKITIFDHLGRKLSPKMVSDWFWRLFWVKNRILADFMILWPKMIQKYSK